jgi:hypothetical protein
LLPDRFIVHQGAAKSMITDAYVVKIPCFDATAARVALAAETKKSYKHQNISENMAMHYRWLATKRRP